MQELFISLLMGFFGNVLFCLSVSILDEEKNNKQVRYSFQVQENERRLEEIKREREKIKPNEVPTSYSELNNTNDNSDAASNFEKALPEYGLNEMNIIDEFIEIEDVIFTYICDCENNQSDTPIYNFKLDAKGHIEDQYILFYTPSGLKKEIMIGHYNEDMMAVDADEMKILSAQEFKKMFLESIDFLKNNKFYSSEIKKHFNLTLFEKICEKGE
jgi:hypothetical protein